MPSVGPFALRDRALLLLLYNTGARVQEIADLRIGDLDLQDQPSVRLHGKGDKWRSCPLWPQTAQLLRDVLQNRTPQPSAKMPVFVSRGERALTRFGIYKVVRRHTRHLDGRCPATGRHISPHVFRHTAAVHLLEAGVDVNVIRAWLGHVRLDTTNRYAEITTRTKLAGAPTLRARRHRLQIHPAEVLFGATTRPCCPGSLRCEPLCGRALEVRPTRAGSIPAVGPQITNGHTTSIT